MNSNINIKKELFGICDCGGFIYKQVNCDMYVLECDRCEFGEIGEI